MSANNVIVNLFNALFIFVFSTNLSAESNQGHSLPNIIVLLADDLGYGELGCQGNSEIPTPHIDSIAKNGVRFTQGYVTAPNCSPSRAAFLTGRLGTRFGYEYNPIGAKNEDPEKGLPLEEITLASYLQKSGYITGLLGKWHLGGAAKYHPFRRGFDEFFGFTHEGHYFVPEPWEGVTTWLRRKVLPGGGKGRRTFGSITYSSHLNHNEPDYDANNPIVRGSQPVNENLYFTDALTREAKSFINRNHDKPFFLYLAYNAVHSPLQGADAYMKKFEHIEDIQRRIFAAMLANLDDSVGEVLKSVRENNLEKNTIIYFLSDNGGPTRELTSSNLPLRGGKGNMYEGGVRVPFMVQWPGKIPAGKEYDKPVLSTDIFATSMVMAKQPVPGNVKQDSVNLMPYLTGEKKNRPHKTLYWRQGKRAAYRNMDMKIVTNKRVTSWELYDLAKDQAESKNLAKDKSELLNKMIEEWKQIDSEMIEAVFR